MKTQFIPIHSLQETDKLQAAGKVLREGGLCAIPTETVYGLAANALDGEAVKRIFAAKGRPQDNPLIVHISCMEELPALVREIPDAVHALAEAYWPGPLTIILPKADCIPEAVTCGQSTVAIRMPSHPIANAIIRAAGVPLAAPSANLSGKPSPTTAQHVLHDLDGRVEMIVDGGECAVGVESTVLTLCSEKPRLLRPGGITREQLSAVLGEVEVDKAVFQALEQGEKPSSPGMKYRHYSPDADVLLIKGGTQAMAAYAKQYDTQSTAVVCFDGEETLFAHKTYTIGAPQDGDAHAHAIFRVLRQTDADGFKTVLVHHPPQDGVDMAVLNRLLRAAAFRVIEV